MTSMTTGTTDPNAAPPPDTSGAEDIAPEDKALWDEFDRLEGEKPAEEDPADADQQPPAPAAAAAPPAAATTQTAADDDPDGNAADWGENDGTGKDDEAAAAAPAASADPAPAGKPAAAAKPEEKPNAAPSAPQTADPLARLRTMTDDQRAAFEAATGIKPDVIVHEISSNRGRISSLQRDINAARRGAPAPTTTTTTPPAAKAPGDVLETAFASEKWKKFAEEYSEVAAPLADTLRDIFGPVIADQANIRSVTSTIETERARAAQAERDSFVLEHHPDFEKIIGDKDFGTWALAQPESVKAVLRANANGIVDPEEAVRVVTTYKLDRGITTTAPAQTAPDATGTTTAPGNGAATTTTANPSAAPAGTTQPSAGRSARREAQLQSAVAPSSRSPGVIQGGEPQTEEQAWDYWEKREKKEEARRRA